MDNLIKILSALLTPTIAVITVYIAYQQYRTNRTKLTLDLYEKRFSVFQTVSNFIGVIVTRQQPTADDVIQLDRAKLNSFFLFGKEVPRYIQTLRDKAESMTLLNSRTKEIAQLGGGELLEQARRSQNEVIAWFEEQNEKCLNVFGKYIAIRS